MAKVVLKATELTNTDVDFVALVKRGANRIPFRITKGDDAVLDLDKIGRRLFQKADPVPAIVRDRHPEERSRRPASPRR